MQAPAECWWRLGWLIGIGAFAIPGVGPFIAAGPIMAALAGAGVGAAVGGLTGALVGMGIPEYEAKRYEGKIKEGNILISVHSENSDEVTRAKDIFERNGAHDISYTEEKGVPKQEKPACLRGCCHETFSQDPEKRDGAMGWALLWASDSHSVTTGALPGARLHIETRGAAGLVRSKLG